MSSDRHINRENYEEFFVDWLDGNLDPSLLPSFMHFLEGNPDLAEQLREMENATLSPERPIPPLNKASLKKKVEAAGQVSEGNFEQKAVAAMEGELTGAEQEDLERFLELNPAYRHDMAVYEKTRLSPDLGVVYPGKDRLKRRPLLNTGIFRIALPAAAAGLLLFLLWRMFLPAPAERPVHAVALPVEEASVTDVKNSPSVAVPATPGSSQDVRASNAPASSGQHPEVAAPRTAPVGMMATVSAPVEVPGPEKGINYVRQAALIPDPVLLAGNEEKPGLLGRVIRNYTGKAAEGTHLIRETVRESKPADELNFWSLAELGVKGFNKMADREVALTVVKDQQGSPKEYLLREDDRVLLSRSLNQP